MWRPNNCGDLIISVSTTYSIRSNFIWKCRSRYTSDCKHANNKNISKALMQILVLVRGNSPWDNLCIGQLMFVQVLSQKIDLPNIVSKYSKNMHRCNKFCDYHCNISPANLMSLCWACHITICLWSYLQQLALLTLWTWCISCWRMCGATS